MARRSSPVFLERQSYRRRRTIDAARCIPVLGIVLVLLPLVWGRDRQTPSTSSAIIYLFGVWTVLVVLALIVAWRLRQSSHHASAYEDDNDDGPI